MEKLHKLVCVHYNMRLRVRNLMHKSGDDYYYSPIDLDHIFTDDDILNEWTRDNEPSVLQDDDLEWLDQDHEISNAQERNKTLAGQSYSKNKNNEGSSRLSKGKGSILSESDETEDDDKSDDSNDSGDGNNRESGKKHHDDDQERQDDQHDTGMSWARGKENYYATQDTDHGYQPGIEEQRRFLASLSSAEDDEHFSGSSHSYVEEHIKNLGLGRDTINFNLKGILIVDEIDIVTLNHPQQLVLDMMTIDTHLQVRLVILWDIKNLKATIIVTKPY